MMKDLRMKVLAMMVLVLLALQGCSLVQTVEPWQKGNLAKPEMSFDDDLLERGYREHIYSSKEASAGGSGVGGGGCGCN
jgi:hypothetical protein